MEQPSLFPNVRGSDPDTSHEAAILERATLRSRVRAQLHAHPEGLTDHELTDLLGLEARRKPSVGKRRQECGAVDTGLRRPSPDGMACVVWAFQTWPAEPECERDSQPSSTSPPGDLSRPTN